ncbi:YhbD family protein [Paenibacillus sp. alder61]|uniref:YhbD family protein n=1 Tax=Paenibacillus sp. alder61 TaxID=2862948 RepID=UPI001CD718CB|nr:YhbD family protein [Paenibacillus sp. alder61]MCA1293950.1 YhbD family protein [Paenibacillus sp. alder61]
MTEELISKKELLDVTGISYGQLYRWKRKNLIPEQWFIRKSSFTGQETFFPREKILQRIDRILNMKDDLSLDALADMFSPSPGESSMSVGEILERNIVSSVSINLYLETMDSVQQPILGFEKILIIYVLDKLLRSGDISLDEGRLLIRTLEANFPEKTGRECGIRLTRKMGVAAFLLVPGDGEVYLDSEVKTVARLSMPACTEELKLRMNGSEGS